MDQAMGLREQMRGHKALRVIGVASGKGGVGKTQLSANLAALAAAKGQRVLVVDGDLGLANVELLFGITPRHHIGQVIDGSVSLDEALSEGPNGIRILSAGHGLPALTRLADVDKLQLVSLMEALEDRFDLVIVDAPSGIGENTVFFAGSGQQVLLVVQPEPTSLSDAYAAVKTLRLKAGVREFAVVVNVSQPGPARDTFDRLSTVCTRFLDVQLRFAGAIPRDENVHRATVAQRPIVQLYPHSPASRAIAAVEQAVFREPQGALPLGGLKFLWGQLLRESVASAR